jgi:MYXO-CTERM domain-containing protein
VQHSNLPKIIGISVLSISTMVLPLTLSASAQVTNPGVERTDVYEDDDSDWGWLGLIGLAGLAGLAGKKRHTPTTTNTYQDNDPVTRSNYRE